MVAVLGEFFAAPLDHLHLLDVGGSTGIVDNFLADHFASVVGIDIASAAVEYANGLFKKKNSESCISDWAGI